MPKIVRIPTYRLHKPSGQARVIVAGKHIYLGVYGSPQSQEKYGRLIAELRAGPPSAVVHQQPSDGLLVVEVVNAFRQWAESHYVKNGKQTSEVHCIRLANDHLMSLYGSMLAAKFGPLALKAVRARMIEAKLCRTTINANIGRIRRMFRWAVENEFVPPSTCHGLEAVKGLTSWTHEGKRASPCRIRGGCHS